MTEHNDAPMCVGACDRNVKRAIRPALPKATPKVRIVKGHMP